MIGDTKFITIPILNILYTKKICGCNFFFVKNLFSYLLKIDESIIIHKKILKIGHKQIS